MIRHKFYIKRIEHTRLGTTVAGVEKITVFGFTLSRRDVKYIRYQDNWYDVDNSRAVSVTKALFLNRVADKEKEDERRDQDHAEGDEVGS